MKINHETLIDEKDFGDNTFRNQTPLEKNEKPNAPKKEKLRLPKRKISSAGEMLFYVFHIMSLILSIVAGFALGHTALLVFAIPYALVLFLAFRCGGELKAKGLHHVIWNVSVLLSTYTNANMKALRQRYKGIGITSVVLMTIGGLFSGLLLATGFILFITFLALSLAEMDTDSISTLARILSSTLLVAGTASFFLNPGLAHGVLVFSLFANGLHEKWKDYEFTRD